MMARLAALDSGPVMKKSAAPEMMKEKESAPKMKMAKRSRARDASPEMAMMSAAPMQIGMAAVESSACDDDMMMRLAALDGPVKRSASPVM